MNGRLQIWNIPNNKCDGIDSTVSKGKEWRKNATREGLRKQFLGKVLPIFIELECFWIIVSLCVCLRVCVCACMFTWEWKYLFFYYFCNNVTFPSFLVFMSIFLLLFLYFLFLFLFLFLFFFFLLVVYFSFTNDRNPSLKFLALLYFVSLGAARHLF